MKKTLFGLAAALLVLIAAASFASAGTSSVCGDPTCCPSSCAGK